MNFEQSQSYPILPNNDIVYLNPLIRIFFENSPVIEIRNIQPFSTEGANDHEREILARFPRTLNSTTETTSIRDEHRHIHNGKRCDAGTGRRRGGCWARKGKGMSRVPLASRRMHDHRSRLLAFLTDAFEL